MRIIDTAVWAETTCNRWERKEAEPIVNDYELAAFPVVVLEEVPVRQ